MNPNPSVNPHRPLNRREWLAASLTAAGGVLVTAQTQAQPAAKEKGVPVRFCLNTGTLRGHNLTIEQEIDITAKAGYQAIEPWMERLNRYVKEGGSPKDLAKRIQDRGLTVESAIGFPSWAVDDESQRLKGFEQIKMEMDLLAQLGSKRIAAPPAGIPSNQKVEPERVAERYRQLLELGGRMGVVPILEFWGRNPTLGKLSTAVFIAVESGHAQACVLADVFHMYRGGSSFEGLRQLGPVSLPLMHLNDYPAQPGLDKINDSHRIMPGDGIAPLGDILRMVWSTGARPVLSLELFNQDYYKKEALEVAQIGLQKMKNTVAAAGL